MVSLLESIDVEKNIGVETGVVGWIIAGLLLELVGAGTSEESHDH